MFLNIKDILVDQKYQSRLETDPELVKSYAELMQEGVQFPPVDVVLVDGKKYVLVDGFHRYQATVEIDEYEIEAKVVHGTWRDVLLHKWRANGTHGKPLTRQEKRRLVYEMLQDTECGKWSSRQIGKYVGASHTLVETLRKEPVESGNLATPKPKTGNLATPQEVKEPTESGNLATPEEESSESDVMIETLSQENAELTKRLAMATLPEEDRETAGKLIDDLRAEIKLLQVELESVKTSRDRYQWENAELKKQVAAQQRQLKKLQG